MKKWTALGRAVAIGAIVLCSAAARGEPADTCAVPGYLLFGDSLLNRVSAAVKKDKTLQIVALGGVSSTLPGPDGPNFAYPARLEAALSRRLPGVKVIVTTLTKPRQTAAEMAESIDKLLLDHKPSLVVWQTGTYDAVRGTDPEEFRASVSDGVEKLHEGGADVVLVNMQYSPRTESIVAISAYADGLRWVSREREVPVFDRLAIMRHWYDAGQFDLYKATKDLKMAKSVHDCLGRALGATIIDAAHLEARQEAAAMRAVPYFFRLATALSFAAAAAAVALVPRARGKHRGTAGSTVACSAPADLRPPRQSAEARGAADRRRSADEDRRHRLVIDRRRGRKLAGDELSEPARGRAQGAVPARRHHGGQSRRQRRRVPRHAGAVRPRRHSPTIPISCCGRSAAIRCCAIIRCRRRNALAARRPQASAGDRHRRGPDQSAICAQGDHQARRRRHGRSDPRHGARKPTSTCSSGLP